MLTELEKYQLQLSSAPENIVQVEPLVEQVRNDFSLSDDIFGNILVALTEAVNNAIIHGNHSNPEKVIHISVSQEKRTLRFLVVDSGNGFDYNNLPDPTAPENLERPTGRGVFLMEQLSDLVVFSKGGSTVELSFKY